MLLVLSKCYVISKQPQFHFFTLNSLFNLNFQIFLFIFLIFNVHLLILTIFHFFKILNFLHIFLLFCLLNSLFETFIMFSSITTSRKLLKLSKPTRKLKTLPNGGNSHPLLVIVLIFKGRVCSSNPSNDLFKKLTFCR